MRLYIAIAAALPLIAQQRPAPERPGPQAMEAELKRFAEAFARIEANAADPVEARQAIFAGAIPGALRRLDPHSTFLDPDQYEQLKQMERSERKGFGSVVSILPGRVIILQTVAGAPAAKAGLSAGDEILAINNIPLNRLEFEQLVQLLTEARQRQVKLDVRRPGNVRLMQFVLNPEVMDSPSVDRAFLLAPGVAYLRVASFDPKTGDLIKTEIDKLGGASLKALVIDLRNNPGGVVEAALRTAALFLEPGIKLLSVKGRAVQGEEITVPREAPAPYRFPTAILINEKTASAAEIVTGALQDNKRSLVFGIQSYGKGLVQSVYNLSSNSALALTTAFYYTPSGRSIQRPLEGELGAAVGSRDYGIHPDEVVNPEPMTRLRAFLDGSGSFTTFATEYTQSHKVEPGFAVSGALLDEFKVWLSGRKVQPRLAEWLGEKQWIESRLQQEIINLALGVDKGDEVEMKRDPVVRRALARILP